MAGSLAAGGVEGLVRIGRHASRAHVVRAFFAVDWDIGVELVVRDCAETIAMKLATVTWNLRDERCSRRHVVGHTGIRRSARPGATLCRLPAIGDCVALDACPARIAKAYRTSFFEHRDGITRRSAGADVVGAIV